MSAEALPCEGVMSDEDWGALLDKARRNGYTVCSTSAEPFKAILFKDGRYYDLDPTGIPTERDDDPYERDMESPFVPATEVVPVKAVQDERSFTSAVMGIPKELVVNLGRPGEERAFVTQAGLLLKAERKGGYRAAYAEITGVIKDGDREIGYEATGYVVPNISDKELEVLKTAPSLSPDLQKYVIEQLFKPYKAIATATTKNVKMASMHHYLRELACTRALNRALRIYTACGFTSAEEMGEYDSTAEMVG